MHKDKVRKIIKFEKMMKKFCKSVGVDKKTLLTMMLGNGKDLENSNAKNNDMNSSRNGNLLNKDSGTNSTVKDSGIINTGVAAQLAYNNMSQSVIEQPDVSPGAQNFMKLRNGMKSRNNNFSLSENRDGNNSSTGSQGNIPQSFISGAHLAENINRGSIVGINSRNYETDTSIFSEFKQNNLNESSFNE